MFHTVLIANRGEIARRIMRTLSALHVTTVAVYSEGDAGAAHVREADRAVCIGPDPATESYLRGDAVIKAALETGAQAIHPGYGFLSENAAFATACAEAGLVFIGPGTRALDVMGDKVRAREHLAEAGVPEVPGFADTTPEGQRLSDAEVADRAQEVGLPLLVKPSAGGGGKGMEIVRALDDLPGALASARRVASAAFGDETMLLERLIERPRHIEVQVFGTASGEVLVLGERECTLQRRHQKVIEEAPNAGGISAETSERMALAAARAAASVQYVGAGTVEFLVDADDPESFFFIEMNTRLQVEHPVTEAVLGVDLVELQVRTAAGEDVLQFLEASGARFTEVIDPETGVRAAFSLEPVGHAVEARVYAESPERGFLPSVGQVLAWREPRGVRVDAAVGEGDAVSASYDPMIAKVVAFAQTRGEALSRLDRALGETTVLGLETNIRFLRALLQHERVRAGEIDTGLIETMLPFAALDPDEGVLAEVSRAATPLVERATPWGRLHGRFQVRGATRAGLESFTLLDETGTEHEATLGSDASVVVVQEPGVEGESEAAPAFWAGRDGASWRFVVRTRRERTLSSLTENVRAVAGHCEAPMPGRVSNEHVAEGARVEQGQPLVSIEAMKMEHPVLAPHAGTVRLLVALGDQVSRGQQVALVEADGHAEDEETP